MQIIQITFIYFDYRQLFNFTYFLSHKKLKIHFLSAFNRFIILFEMVIDKRKLFLLLMLLYVFIFHLLVMTLLLKIFFSDNNYLSKTQKTYLNIFSSVFFLIKSVSLLYLIFLYLGFFSFNLTFYLVFFLYNMFPLIYMKKFIQTLYPEKFVFEKSMNLLDENVLKYGISKRENEIILLILEGFSNKGIEDKLFISLATVKDHIYNIYKKTGVKNRVQLVNLFLKKKN